jgi:alpha-galactosidase
MPSIDLDTLELGLVIQGWETAKAGRSVTGGPLSIGGRVFASGIGTHTVGTIDFELDGRAVGFTAQAGVDDAVGARGLGRVRFLVQLDGRTVFDSGIRTGGQAAVPITVDLAGGRRLRLLAEAPDDNTHHGHADWAEARIAYTGAPPRLVGPARGTPPTFPDADPRPRFLGGLRVGARPGRPVIHRLACIGAGELHFTAGELPGDLTLDPDGVLRGRAPADGAWRIPVTARNAYGTTSAVLHLTVGNDALAPLPPMGWNSWNGYGDAVTQADLAANHRALMAQGLHRHGYRYLTIDDGWQGGRTGGAIPRALQPNAKFPDLAGLTAALHSDGCLAGIYSVACTFSPQGRCGGSGDRPDGTSISPFVHGEGRPVGPYTFFAEDAAQWVAWDFDFVKLDCRPPPAAVRAIAAAILDRGRDLVISLSAGIPLADLPAYRGHAQMWRTTGDLIDTWPSVRNKLRAQLAFVGAGGPGGWNDADMLVVGETGPGWNTARQPSRLSWREQALHLGMWSFLAAPLFLGCDLTRLDAGTRALLTRPGLIDLNQDPLGAAARCELDDPETGLMRWTRPLAGGDLAMALVNLGEEPREVAVDLADHAGTTAIDCWTGEPVALDRQRLACRLEAHDHRLVRFQRAVDDR